MQIRDDGPDRVAMRYVTTLEDATPPDDPDRRPVGVQINELRETISTLAAQLEAQADDWVACVEAGDVSEDVLACAADLRDILADVLDGRS